MRHFELQRLGIEKVYSSGDRYQSDFVEFKIKVRATSESWNEGRDHLIKEQFDGIIVGNLNYQRVSGRSLAVEHHVSKVPVVL